MTNIPRIVPINYQQENFTRCRTDSESQDLVCEARAAFELGQRTDQHREVWGGF